MLDEEFRIFPGWNFTCDGHITSLLLGADIPRKNGNGYPEIQIWRNTGDDNYTRQASQEIRLTSGDFSPDGVLQYNLTTPMSFQSGDVLGVYQPDRRDSAVRLYYTYETSAASVTFFEWYNPTIISLSSLAPIYGQVALVTPLTSKLKKTAITNF